MLAFLAIFSLSGCGKSAKAGPVEVDTGNPFIDIFGVILILLAIALIATFITKR
jgi:hypothetical protein